MRRIPICSAHELPMSEEIQNEVAFPQLPGHELPDADR